MRKEKIKILKKIVNNIEILRVDRIILSKLLILKNFCLPKQLPIEYSAILK
jgi:hypothetical protein